MSEKTKAPESLLTLRRSTPVSELRRLSDAVESCARAAPVEKARMLMKHSSVRKRYTGPRESVMDSSSLSRTFEDERCCNPRFSKRRHSSIKVLEVVKNYLSARSIGLNSM